MLSTKTKNLFYLYTAHFRSMKTREDYRYVLEQCSDLLEKDILEMHDADVLAYIEILRKRGNKEVSIAKKLRVLSSFGEFLESRGEYVNPFYRHSLSGDVPDVSNTLTHENVLAFLRAVRVDNFTMYILSSLIYRTGVSIGELLELRIPKDLVRSGDTGAIALALHNEPPYKRRVYVPVPADLMEDFVEYIDWRVKTISKSDAMFLAIKRGSGPLSAWSAQQYMREFWQPSINFNALKNLAITRLFESGAKVEDVANYLGKTTRWLDRYCKAVPGLPKSLADQSANRIELNRKEG